MSEMPEKRLDWPTSYLIGQIREACETHGGMGIMADEMQLRHEALLSALTELHGAVVDLPLKGHGPVAKAIQSAARILGEQE